MTKRLAIILPIIVILAVFTCVYADKINITTTSRQFLESHNMEERLSCMTIDARANMVQNRHMSSIKPVDGQNLTYMEPIIHGRTASIEVNDATDGSTRNILLWCEDRQWRIYAVELDATDYEGHKIKTLNFEEPN